MYLTLCGLWVFIIYGSQLFHVGLFLRGADNVASSGETGSNVHTCNPSTRGRRQEDQMVKVSLAVWSFPSVGYIRSGLKAYNPSTLECLSWTCRHDFQLAGNQWKKCWPQPSGLASFGTGDPVFKESDMTKKSLVA